MIVRRQTFWRMKMTGPIKCNFAAIFLPMILLIEIEVRCHQMTNTLSSPGASYSSPLDVSWWIWVFIVETTPISGAKLHWHRQGLNQSPISLPCKADICAPQRGVPPQSHTMTDVGYQFRESWFAEETRELALAAFLLE